MNCFVIFAALVASTSQQPALRLDHHALGPLEHISMLVLGVGLLAAAALYRRRQRAAKYDV